MESRWERLSRFLHCQLLITHLYPFAEEKTVLSDLEKLARREKIYCMTQQFQSSDSESSSQVATPNKANRL